MLVDVSVEAAHLAAWCVARFDRSHMNPELLVARRYVVMAMTPSYVARLCP